MPQLHDLFIEPTELFQLKDRNDIEKFEELMDEYGDTVPLGLVNHFSLLKAYDFISDREDRNRIIASLVDIKINTAFLSQDLTSIGADANQIISLAKTNILQSHALDSKDTFIQRINLHCHISNFVTRYRALWDKIMGFFILFFLPCEYELFIKAKSRKKKFKQVALSIAFFPKDYVISLEKLLENFDNKYRTAEIHGTGTLRKLTFFNHVHIHNQMIGHWNILNDHLHLIGSIFNFPNSINSES